MQFKMFIKIIAIIENIKVSSSKSNYIVPYVY